MHPRRVAIAEGEVIVDDGAAEACGERLLDAHPHRPRELFARHYHERDHVAAHRVDLEAQPHVGFGPGVEHKAQLRTQFLEARAAQFLLGETVEDTDDFLVVVRARLRMLGCEQFGELGPQDRDMLRLLGIGLRGEEADETIEGDHAAVGAGAADCDVIHRGASMDPRFGVRLADNQGRTVEQEFAIGFVERAKRHGARVTRARLVAQNAESRTGFEGERLDVPTRVDAVTAVAEKDETAVHQPSQELANLDQLADRGGLVADFERARRHRVEIARGEMDLVEYSPDIGFERGGIERRGRGLDLGVRERLEAFARGGLFEGDDRAMRVAGDVEERMQNHADGCALVVEVLEQARDDERAVRHHGLDGDDASTVCAGDYPHFDRIGTKVEELEGVRGDREASFGGKTIGQMGRQPCEQALRENLYARRLFGVFCTIGELVRLYFSCQGMLHAGWKSPSRKYERLGPYYKLRRLCETTDCWVAADVGQFSCEHAMRMT